MKKSLFILFCLPLFLLGACNSGGDSQTSGRDMYFKGVLQEAKGNYRAASSLYEKALPLLRQENNELLVKNCRIAAKRTCLIVEDFQAGEEQIRETLSRRFVIAPETIDRLLSKIAFLDMDGSRYYYSDYLDTCIHLELSLMHQLPEVMARNRQGYSALKPFVDTPGPESGSPFINPTLYKAVAAYDIPRDLLPSTGLLKIWQPVPIETDCQKSTAVLSAEPAEFVVQPGTINGKLGNMYLEIPLDDLTHDLVIQIHFQFRHYEQRFTMIDPENIGLYDITSDLYQEFTTSRKNIRITPEIRAKAEEIVGEEKNPYLAARMLYDYIVNRLTYSHMPYGALQSLDIPVSVYVHEHGYGDCGAQSMYFAALCGALGIPARAAGGQQLFPGMEGGHFWAEFFLPNYGWIPVDTSVSQISNYLPELSEKERRAFQDYLFGSMDPYRWVIQKDTDVPFNPPADEQTALSLALQAPAALCDEMNSFPEEIIWPHYRISFSPE
jgi:transglutaminase-like putative cysteine protease